MKKITNATLYKFQEMFIPVVDNKLKVTIDGNIAAPHAGKYNAFINGELTEVPSEYLVDVPIYRINKPYYMVKVGDIIKTGNDKKYTYQVVRSIDGDKFTCDCFGGTVGRVVVATKDLLTDRKIVNVVVNLMGEVFNSLDIKDPWKLLAMDDIEDDRFDEED